VYIKAVKSKKEQFTFKGRDILTSYCKYLLEYLSGRCKKSIIKESDKVWTLTRGEEA
jgi:hypothetical protein